MLKSRWSGSYDVTRRVRPASLHPHFIGYLSIVNYYCGFFTCSTCTPGAVSVEQEPFPILIVDPLDSWDSS